MDDNLARTRLAKVEEMIEKAVLGAGRKRSEIVLVAVGKTKPAEDLLAYHRLGIRDFGENYARELDSKVDRLPGDVRWHMIGHLQSNKAGVVARRAAWFHTVDGARIAERLDALRPEGMEPLNALIEVNVSREASKSGVAPEEVRELAGRVAALPRLRFRGLMCVAENASEEVVDGQFATMARLMADLRAAGHEVDTLSMGMTGDMAIAIRNGSTMVRVGTALFGPR